MADTDILFLTPIYQKVEEEVLHIKTVNHLRAGASQRRGSLEAALLSLV